MCLGSLCIELGSCWQPHYPSWDYESDDDIEDSEEEVDVEEEEVDSEVSDGDGNGIKSTSKFGFEFAKGGMHWSPRDALEYGQSLQSFERTFLGRRF